MFGTTGSHYHSYICVAISLPVNCYLHNSKIYTAVTRTEAARPAPSTAAGREAFRKRSVAPRLVQSWPAPSCQPATPRPTSDRPVLPAPPPTRTTPPRRHCPSPSRPVRPACPALHCPNRPSPAESPLSAAPVGSPNVLNKKYNHREGGRGGRGGREGGRGGREGERDMQDSARTNPSPWRVQRPSRPASPSVRVALARTNPTSRGLFKSSSVRVAQRPSHPASESPSV